MSRNIVSFRLAQPAADSGAEPVAADAQSLHHKLQELHDFVDQQFRQQARLLRDLRRFRRLGSSEISQVSQAVSESLERSDSWDPHCGSGFAPELPRVAEEQEQTKIGQELMPEKVSAIRPVLAGQQAQESILLRSPEPEALSEPGATARDTRESVSAEQKTAKRFAVRLSTDAASNRPAKSQLSSSSKATDNSSPDSFVLADSRFQFTAAQVQSTWQQRRRANSDDSNPLGEVWGPSRYARAVVASNIFSGALTLLILLHVIMMGVEVDLAASADGDPLPDWFSTINLVFASLFVGELLLKFAAFGCRTFWCSSDWAWNAFDFLVISLSVLDVVLEYSLRASVSASQVRILRVLRSFRYLRSIRVLRLFRYISSLRVLILSILGTVSSLAWTLALLILIIYSFAVALTEVVWQHCNELRDNGNIEDDCPVELTKHWVNVRRSMLSLFMAISQGLNWEDLVGPLLPVSIAAAVIVIAYVIITIFAILNVVTGVFCNTAIESAGADKDVRTLKQMQAKNTQVELLKKVFAEIDFEQCNEISFRDVERCLANGDLSNFMESMGISTDDVWTLFMLLDVDKTGFLDVDEFVNGCIQLHGPAQSLQVAKMNYENKLTRTAIKNVYKEVLGVHQRLDRTRQQLGRQGSPQDEDFVSVKF